MTNQARLNMMMARAIARAEALRRNAIRITRIR